MNTLKGRLTGVVWSDAALVVSLVGLDVVARLLPHAPNFTPIAASALFAATVLRLRWLALVVPVAALLISDTLIGFDSWQMTVAIHLCLTLPALAGILSCRIRASAKSGLYVPVMLASSLIFFAATNLAVWAFSGMYPPTLAGLVACYVAALPFLQTTMLGDFVWSTVLFGGAWLVALLPMRRLA